MSEFKAGDKVIFVEVKESYESYDIRHFSVGKEYTVVNCWANFIEVIGNEGCVASCRMDQVKLVQEEEMQEETQVEKVSKYTVEEVFQAIDETSDFFNPPWREIEEIKERLAHTKDPEYKEYLRLKSKFE